jgi:osmotically-inducible protein OsmY
MSLLFAGCILPNGTPLADGPKDSTVSAEVEAKLAEDRLENLSGILVSSDRGMVTLTGTVQKAEQKARAAELARQVKGVRRVKNDLEIQATMPP